MRLGNKVIFSFLLLLATPCLAMCSSTTSSSEVLAQEIFENRFKFELGMMGGEVSNKISTFQFTNKAKYVLSFNWTDVNSGVESPFPDGLSFTVSAWAQEKEIFYRRFHPAYLSETEHEFLTIKKSDTNKPIELLVIGTVSPWSGQNLGTLELVIYPDSPS